MAAITIAGDKTTIIFLEGEFDEDKLGREVLRLLHNTGVTATTNNSELKKMLELKIARSYFGEGPVALYSATANKKTWDGEGNTTLTWGNYFSVLMAGEQLLVNQYTVILAGDNTLCIRQVKTASIQVYHRADVVRLHENLNPPRQVMSMARDFANGRKIPLS